MPIKKPAYFSKVIQTLSQLSATKGFSIKQITEHLQQFGLNRDFTEIKTIVEQALKYGIRNKLLQERSGKYNFTPVRLRMLQEKSKLKDKKTKRVRFKKTSIDINGSEKICNKRNTSSTNKKSSVKSAKKTKPKKQPTKSNPRNKKTYKRQNSSQLKVYNNENKEALDVTPEKDVHDNCVNKNKNHSKAANERKPPRLESESEIEFEPPRPPNKVIRKTRSRHSNVHKQLIRENKHSSSILKQRKRLKDLIPDGITSSHKIYNFLKNLISSLDKNYRKHKMRSRHYSFKHVSSNSEDSSDNDTRSVKERKHHCRRNCCKRSRRHHSHHSSNDFSLKRKDFNSILDHLNQNAGEQLTPFDVFLETNHTQLETIPENKSIEDEAEDVEDGGMIRHRSNP